MPSNIFTEAGLGTRINQYWQSIPFTTSSTLILCVSIYLFNLLTGFDSFEEICFSPYMIISQYQVYRFITSIFFHIGILHVLFNMMTFISMGSFLERNLGSIRLFFLILLFSFSNAVVNIFLSSFLSFLPMHYLQNLMNECAVGFSGVIFSLIVLETHSNGNSHHSIFGFFSVPSKWYPWALLIIFQILMPKVSLIGHLSGLISGLLYINGIFYFLLPNSSLISYIESSSLLSRLVSRPGFIIGGSFVITPIPVTNLHSSWNAVGNSASSALSNYWNRIQQLFRSNDANSYSRISQNENFSNSRNSPATAAAATDSRFPGKGRKLSESGLEISPSLSSSNGMRTMNNNINNSFNHNHNNNNILSNASEPSPAFPNRSYPNPYASENNQKPISQNFTENLQKLLDMGFDKASATSVLSACNGDLIPAIEFLSNNR